MSRFLTISHVEGGPTRIHGPLPAKVGDDQPPAPLVAEFADGMDAMRFLSAIANAANNPSARADYLERRQMYVEPQEVHGGQRWVAYWREPLVVGADLTIATFAERADADLFVNWMRVG